MSDLIGLSLMVILAVSLIAVLGWWLFVQTEGVYLGPRVVRFLYDKSARQYDDIKEFSDDSDDRHLGEPLAERLAGREDAWVLDVATGTARLPLTLFRHMNFKGRVVGLDSSRGMLEAALAKTAFFSESMALIENEGRILPFADKSCDAVTCIEALEFLPDPAQSLREMARVLKPGGILLITNRCGFDRWTFPGRGYAPSDFEQLLLSIGMTNIETTRWLTYYDLIWATKGGKPA